MSPKWWLALLNKQGKWYFMEEVAAWDSGKWREGGGPKEESEGGKGALCSYVPGLCVPQFSPM